MDTIAQIKLKEIQNQRERLLSHFEVVESDSKAAPTLNKRLEILLTGILKKKHSLGEQAYQTKNDIHHLEVLLRQAQYDNVTTELLQSWVTLLEREIQFGRSQTEFAYLFGSVIQEWVLATKKVGKEEEIGDELDFHEGDDEYFQVLFPKEREAFVKKVEALFTPVPDSKVDFAYFDRLVEDLKRLSEEPQARLEKADRTLLSKVTLEEIKAASSALCMDNLVDAPTKKSLKGLLRDDVLANEYAGVVTLMIKNYQEWNWPSEQPLKLVNNRSAKWRVFVNEDIITALFLQVLGARWGALMRSIFQTYYDLYYPFPQYTQENVDYYYRQYCNQLMASALPKNSVDISNVSDYDNPSGGGSADKGPTLKQKLLQLMAIEGKRSREQKTPLTTVVTDIENFYLSVSHKLILQVVRGFGVPESWVEFFAKFLSPPVNLDEKKGRLSQGFPTGHALSKVLHEPLLFLCDFTMSKLEGLRYQRNFDDFFMWSETPSVALKAWEQLNEFIKKGGMALNLTKSGHVVANGPKDASGKLPEGLVRYGLLALDAQGHWVADQAGVDKVIGVMKMRLQKATSILAWVRCYNSHIKFLARGLGDPCIALGSVHIDSVCKVLSGLHAGINGVGVIRHLQSELEKRFNEKKKGVQVPEAWFYWPLTAGGLGVFNPFLTLSVLQLQILKGEQQASQKFQKKAKNDSVVFNTLTGALQPQAPATTTELQGRIEDFKKRGSNLRGKKQSTLGVYWQWLLCNYAHQILQTVGSLEFTDPELVPIALIQGVSGDDEE